MILGMRALLSCLLGLMGTHVVEASSPSHSAPKDALLEKGGAAPSAGGPSVKAESSRETAQPAVAPAWKLPVELAARTRSSRGQSDFAALRVTSQIPRIRSVAEGRRYLNDVRNKVERRYGKAFLAGLTAEEGRGRLVSALEKTLPSTDLGFLALILTSLGEARGQVSAECRGAGKLAKSMDLRRLCVNDRLGRKNLLLVMRIIENRSEERRFVTPEAFGQPAGLRLWAAVTMPLKYSSWNPGSPNLAHMISLLKGARSGGHAGDLKNGVGLTVEDSVALDRAFSVYADYISPETRYKDFEKLVDSQRLKATHMLNEVENENPASVAWTLAAILEGRRSLVKTGALTPEGERRSILVGMRLPTAEIFLPGEKEAATKDVLAHIPVYIRSVSEPTIARLESLAKEEAR